MSREDDHLSQRVASWLEKVGVPQAKAGGVLALQGWALREELRRSGPAGHNLMDTINPRIGTVQNELIPTVLNDARQAWQNLLADLDKPEDNAESVRHQTREVFFTVLEALILTEEAGGAAGGSQKQNQAAAEQLFNTVISDIYVFEPLADLAAKMQRWGTGQTRLSDLLCTAVAGLYGGEIRQTVDRVESQEDQVPVFAPIERFVRDDAAPNQRLTLDQFAQRLAASPWWYVKWAAQRLKLSILPATRELRVEIFDPAETTPRTAPSRGLDGWDIRLTHARQPATATIQNGSATLKLPPQLDPASLTLQLRDPAAREWVELYGRAQ
jgi:hypothetical protein